MFFNSRECELGDVIHVAKAAGNFKTLLKILSEVEVPGHRSMTLIDILKMPREMTIFAPTDEAFAKLPKGTLESWNEEQKLKIISRHFFFGVSTLASDVATGPVKTYGNESIKLFNTDAEGAITQYNEFYDEEDWDDEEDDRWFKIDYKGNIISAVTTDILAKNGVIHAMDKVILPLADE